MNRLRFPFRRQRYDGRALASQLVGQIPVRDGGDWCLWLFPDPDGQGDVFDFVVYVPRRASVRRRALALLDSFLGQLGQLDDAIQAECESEWRASAWDASAFALHIAYLMPSAPDATMRVEYHGTVVNTSWEARYRLDGDRWDRVRE